MESKLINLTSLSQQALKLGEKLCHNADTLVKECKNDIENIEIIYPKLRFIWGELGVQVQSVQKLKKIAAKQNGILQEFYANKEQELSIIIDKLDNTLESLRHKHVDSAIRENAVAIERAMARENNSNILGDLEKGIEFDLKNKKDLEEKPYLYDYIEEQGVQDLKTKTQEEVSAIQQYHATSSKILEQINTQQKQLDEMLLNNNISLEKDFSHQKFIALEQVASSMAETLVSLARNYDQVSAALKACQLYADANLNLDISVLEKDTSLLPTIVQELEEGLQHIESLSEEVRIINHIYHASYDEASKLFSELDNFGSSFENFSNTIKELEVDFEKSSVIVDRFLDELLNLNMWYEEFSRAYDYMIIEIDRRYKVKEQHEKLIEDYSNKLEGLYLEESKQRDLFLQNYGRYLPADLCPPIQEFPIRYEIITQDETKLPVLSYKTLLEAQENLLKYKSS
ncbi:autophagy-related protein 17 [Gigaspora rosea]|uniref:Autophagy-related protein 17 n=1 Tax=Gigaspora rosea TaxID=44941 RepID=A0A397U251_9GLOM|nr:autophagy-related protein 17 [Gigaspora rosea]